MRPGPGRRAPFRGLEAYEFEHAPIFFGQDEALTKGMLQLTGNADAGLPFLLVLGASGSGKSSLVKAGIVPKLFVPRRISGIAFLRRVIFRPSDAQADEDLFDALARRLTTQVSEQEGLSELIGHGQSLANLAAHFRNTTADTLLPDRDGTWPTRGTSSPIGPHAGVRDREARSRGGSARRAVHRRSDNDRRTACGSSSCWQVSCARDWYGSSPPCARISGIEPTRLPSWSVCRRKRAASNYCHRGPPN